MMRIALVAAVVAVVVASAAATSIGEANLWASNFGDQMVNLTETELRVVELQDLFNSGYTASQAVDGGDLADQLRTSLEQLVSDKRDAVLALKTAIEDSYAAAASTCTDPVRDTTQPNSLPPLTWHENFKTVVNTDYTSIRFADGISQLDFDVDDDICRSLPAEQVMIDNFANDPTLKWQYFGSDNGVFRQFPAKEWSKTGGVYNAYDNRFRPWYVASSAGPKDVVIILDTSGSMQIAGRLELAKDAVDSVLGTLTPNDFVNLVIFNTAAEQLTPCLPDTLYRATPAVIDHLRDEVANLNHGGRTNFVDAFDVAFDLFDASSERTTECQKAILFLTDGEADSPIERIAERQGAHDVKIFSFALGSEADIEVPREVACSNAGIFSAIDDGDGDLRTQMASYYQYFAAGIENELTWSSPYFDASGLGIVTTLAAPCYKRTVTPYEIVGVVGVDVAIDQFTQEVYNFQSANSYAFMINNQGDVMTHPRFSDPGSIDSAIYVDIADLESSDSDFLTNVRRPMVRRDDGSYEMTVNRVIPRGDARYDGVRTKAIQTEYHFRPVDGSPFSVAYALSNYDKIGYALPLQSSDVVDDSYYHEFTLLPSADSTAVNAAVQGSGAKLEGLLVSYDRSCFKGAPSSYTSPNNYIFGIENSATVANIQTWANTNSGNAGFRSPILRELRRTVPMEDLWKDNHGPGTLWQYFGTKNGFIRKYPGSPYLTKEYDPTQRTWYRRSVSYPVDTALSTPYLDASGAGQVITLSKAIFEGAVHSGPFTDSDPVAGVAGMDFSYETFEDIFLQTVPCPGTSRCWLMDYSGYLVTYDTFLGASNPATFENVFIGEREKPFFDRMLADQFFVRQDFENYETFESCFYYEVDLDAFPSGYSATVSGAGCRSGTIYAVAVPNTQVYLIAIDNYSSSGICATEVPSCTPFNYDVCQSDSLDENRVATIQCPDFELSDTQLENLRGDEPCNAAGGAVSSVLAVILAALIGLVLSA